MPNTRQPRSGSLQFWPRKRAKREYPRIRTPPSVSEPGLVGFAGYKASMTHLVGIETNKFSHKKGQEIVVPVTIVECPPVKIAALRLYKKTQDGKKAVKDLFFYEKHMEKDLRKRTDIPKKDATSQLDKLSLDDYDDATALVYTQPNKALSKKKPEFFELGLGGSLEDKIKYVKENLKKEITVDSVFEDSAYTDIKAVTKGKGFQGPVKRFGITIRAAKSEKAIRNPGSLGPWVGQGHIMWRVAHAGKMGYHQRTEYNKQILKIVQDPKEVNPKGGIVNYGLVKNTCVLIKGSVPGAKKRIIVMQKPSRLQKPKDAPTIVSISTAEQQGN